MKLVPLLRAILGTVKGEVGFVMKRVETVERSTI